MRLIATLTNEEHAREFSYFLTKEGIANELQPYFTPSSSEAGQKPEQAISSFLLWIVNEEDVERAKQWYEQFAQDPNAPHFSGHGLAARRIMEERLMGPQAEENQKKPVRGGFLRIGAAKSTVTFLIVIAAALIYIFGNFSTRQIGTSNNETQSPQERPIAILSPLYQSMLYDFPTAFQLYAKLARLYTDAQLEHPSELPPEGQAMLHQALTTPYWQGLYQVIINSIHPAPTVSQPNTTADLFEDIRAGQWWRLWSPCLLHADFFHILFNVIWLIILGIQIEPRIGSGRYLLILLVSGIISNTAQYLVSGPIFLGLSGLVTTQFGFIWMRQLKAPWEGYQLNRITILFILIFIVGMAALQTVSFFSEIAGGPVLSPGIANTAHLSGLAVGAIFGSLPFFRYHRKQPR
jgi:GlpG protein